MSILIGVCSMCGEKTPMIESTVGHFDVTYHRSRDGMCEGTFRPPAHTFTAPPNVKPFMKEYAHV